MAASIVQKRWNSAQVSATTTVVGAGQSLATIATGNRVVVGIMVHGNTVAPTGVTDSVGNTYTLDAGPAASSSGNGIDEGRTWTYSCASVTGSPTSVTVTFGSAVGAYVWVYELAAIRSASGFDQAVTTGAAQNSAGPAATGSYTPGFADSIGIAFVGCDSSQTIGAPGTGWTKDFDDGTAGVVVVMSKVYSSAASDTASIALGGTRWWNVNAVLYKGLAAGSSRRKLVAALMG